MNIKETVDSKRPIAYIALRGGNHKPLLLNNQNKLTITPDRSKLLNTEVNITTAQGINDRTMNIKLVKFSVLVMLFLCFSRRIKFS